MSDGPAIRFLSSFRRLFAVLLKFLVAPGCHEFCFAEQLSITESLRTVGDSCRYRNLPSLHIESFVPRVADLSFTRSAPKGTGNSVSLNKKQVTYTLRINLVAVLIILSFGLVNLANRRASCGCDDVILLIDELESYPNSSDL